MNIDDIEKAISNNDMTAASVFTQMQQHASEWISVKDRLPEDCTIVLFTAIALSLNGSVTLQTFKGMWLGGCKTFETDVSREFYAPDEVTHWMPCPEPPIQKRDLFGELKEGIESLSDEREGKITLTQTVVTDEDKQDV